MTLKLTINELAKVVNIPASTIRYYCNHNFFKPSGTYDNGYRYFTLEKIEELRFITYLRHLDVPLSTIQHQLNNRNISDYEAILQQQLDNNEKKMKELAQSQLRLNHRLQSLNYIDKLPPLDAIQIEHFEARNVLRLDLNTRTQYDYEVALLEFETLGDLPPSLIIGDQGFIVDLSATDDRSPEEFIGMYMIYDKSLVKSHPLSNSFPEGPWLTHYIKGNHSHAAKCYRKLTAYAKEHNLTLAPYALERTLINHYISDDETNYITEIQIPIF